jgi:hypothetical protein
MKKLLVLIGVTAILCAVGCNMNTEVKDEVQTTSIYEETVNEAEETSEEIESYVHDLYIDTFKEIYGDDFNVERLEMVDNDTISYEGKTVSWDYVEELAYNSMTNVSY